VEGRESLLQKQSAGHISCSLRVKGEYSAGLDPRRSREVSEVALEDPTWNIMLLCIGKSAAAGKLC
jgi:hypothetical protein